MDLDALKGLLDGFDLAKFLPDITSLLGWMEVLLRLAVMAAPLIVLALGLIYLLAPPKEANYSLGYRFWWSMASLESWQFTHRVAGIAFSAVGLILTVVMALLCNGFRGMEPMDMAWLAGKCLLWQIGILAAVCIVIDIVVVIVFDHRGFRRREK